MINTFFKRNKYLILLKHLAENIQNPQCPTYAPTKS